MPLIYPHNCECAFCYEGFPLTRTKLGCKWLEVLVHQLAEETVLCYFMKCKKRALSSLLVGLVHALHYFHSIFLIQIWLKIFYLQEALLHSSALISRREYSHCVFSFIYTWPCQVLFVCLILFLQLKFLPSSELHITWANSSSFSSWVFLKFVQKFALSWATLSAHCCYSLFILFI